MLLVINKVIEFLRFSTYKTSITLLYDGLGTPNPSAKIEKRNETEGKNEVFLFAGSKSKLCFSQKCVHEI